MEVARNHKRKSNIQVDHINIQTYLENTLSPYISSIPGHHVALFTTALTHPSLAKQKNTTYERYEFLGDSVLRLSIAQLLFHMFPNQPEGKLAKYTAHLVSGKVLSKVAEDLKLGDIIQMSEGEVRSGGRKKPAILADSCEAFLGAIFDCFGYDVAFKFIQTHWQNFLKNIDQNSFSAKAKIQEWAQAKKLGLPHYHVVERSGSDHQPFFTVKVSVPDYSPIIGEGFSIKEAETSAAENFIKTYLI